MSACDRFEREGLAEAEDGSPSDAHVATCPECQRMKRVHERLRKGIPAAAARHDPPPGWEGRVWGRIAERRRRPPRILRLVPAGLAAAAAVVAVAFWARPRPAGGPEFMVAVDLPQDTARRGADAPIGSRMRLDAPAGAPFAELRVYRDDTVLELRCSTEPPCHRQDGRVRASLALSVPGSYQPVLVRSERPLPAPTATLDLDAEAALNAGARVELGRPVRVR